MSEGVQNLTTWMNEYSQLSQQVQTLEAPFLAEKKALEVKMEDATAHLTFRMATLEALIKPAILDLKQTQKFPYITAIYSSKDEWDGDTLLGIGKEVPAVMQALKKVERVTLRKTIR